jgi:hypothetical protein
VDISFLTKRYSRRALPRPNAVYAIWRFVANGVRTARSLLQRSRYGDTPGIARELKQQGIVVGPSDRFLTRDGRRALHDVSARILETSRSPAVAAAIAGAGDGPDRYKKYLVDLVEYPEGIEADDALLKLALDEKLLEIVAGYLGLWPQLHSIAAWLNYPTEAPPELSQLWHRDPEDLRLVKVFIYLTEVHERSGPFTYIPRTQPFGAEAASAQKLERKKRLADDRMTKAFPPASWRVCTGPPHTMILADTVGYHRGGKPSDGHRILVTFTYTSGAPITSRELWIRGNPAWLGSGIQRSAAEALLARPPVQPRKKKTTTKIKEPK